MSHRTVLRRGITPAILVAGLVSFAFLSAPCAGADETRPSSYSPVVIREDFEQIAARMEAATNCRSPMMEKTAALVWAGFK